MLLPCSIVLLHHLAELNPRLSFLEVGVFRGRSAKIILETFPKITYVGVDLFDQAPGEELPPADRPKTLFQMKRLLWKYRKRAELIRGNSIDILPELSMAGRVFDCIFIDGGHSYETCRTDVENAMKLVDDNSMIIIDDYGIDDKIWPINRVVKEFISRGTGYDVWLSYETLFFHPFRFDKLYKQRHIKNVFVTKNAPDVLSELAYQV